MAEDENYQFNYQKLLRFLTREGGGYIFALVDDARYIRQINESLKAELKNKHNIDAGIIFLDEKSDEPVPHQLTVAAEKYCVLLVANMYEIARDTKDGRAAITRLNFNREAIQALPCKTVFWVQRQSLAFVANFAADLYVQRALTTIHFTGVMESIVPEMPRATEWEHFISSEKFEETDARIATFKRRLAGAEEAGYPIKRIAEEIVLPLAADYATLGIGGNATVLLEKYLPVLNLEDADVLAKLADIYYSLRQLDKAVRYREAALHIIEIKLSREPDNELLKGQTAVAFRKLGDINNEIGEFAKAESFFKRYCAVVGQLFQSNPQSESLKRSLARSYNKLGEINREHRRFGEALEYFTKSNKLSEELYQSNPQSESLTADLADSYRNLGDSNQDQGRFAEALEYFTKSNKLSEELYQSNPQSEWLKDGLSVSYSRLGEISQAEGRLAEALEYYNKSLELCKELFHSNPQSVVLYDSLAISYWKIGDVHKEMKKNEEARGWFEKAAEIWAVLSEQNSSVPRYKRLLDEVGNDLKELQTL